MKIDQRRLKRQQEVVAKWTAAGRRGTLEAVTGFGKTFVALLILQDMNERLPSGTALVVVPTQNLKTQWEESLAKMHITGVTVMVINSAVKMEHDVDLLILDEIHNYMSEVFRGIFACTEYRYILGLTATLDQEDPRFHVISQAAPVFETITLREAVRNEYVSQFQIFNLGLRMSENEAKNYKLVTDDYYEAFAIFNNRFHVAQGCLRDRNYLSVFTRTLSGWTEEQVLGKARAFNTAMNKRKQLIYKSATKREAAKKLIEILEEKFKNINFVENDNISNSE